MEGCEVAAEERERPIRVAPNKIRPARSLEGFFHAVDKQEGPVQQRIRTRGGKRARRSSDTNSTLYVYSQETGASIASFNSKCVAACTLLRPARRKHPIVTHDSRVDPVPSCRSKRLSSRPSSCPTNHETGASITSLNAKCVAECTLLHPAPHAASTQLSHMTHASIRCLRADRSDCLRDHRHAQRIMRRARA